MNHFDEKYRLAPAIGSAGWLTCENLGEHQGDPHYQPDVLGTMWERWSCCDEETPLKDPNE